MEDTKAEVRHVVYDQKLGVFLGADGHRDAERGVNSTVLSWSKSADPDVIVAITFKDWKGVDGYLKVFGVGRTDFPPDAVLREVWPEGSDKKFATKTDCANASIPW